MENDHRSDTILERTIARLRDQAGDAPDDIEAVCAAMAVLFVATCVGAEVEPEELVREIRAFNIEYHGQDINGKTIM